MDLPSSNSKEHSVDVAFRREANCVNARVLEVGREPIQVRGVLLALVPLGIAGAILLGVLSFLTPAGDVSLSLRTLGMIGAVLALVGAIVCLRIDVMLPRQVPVRFNRVTKKIYWLSYRFSWNSFRPHTQLKIWEWSAVEAEILKMAGFNGKIYTARYFLSLANCEQGAKSVLDREILLGPSLTTVEFEQAWAYLCKYMNEGFDAVPKEPLKDNSVHYIRSLFVYVPWMMLNQWGRAARQDMFDQGVGAAVANALVALITLPLLPLFFLLGIANYVALRFAPEARWPEDMDAESRGITVEELRAEKERIQHQPKEGPRWSSIVAACISVLMIGWIVGRVLGLVPPI